MLKESRQIILWKRLSDSIAPFSLKNFDTPNPKISFWQAPKEWACMVFGESCATPQMNSKGGKEQRLHSQQTKCWQHRRLLCPWSLVLGPWCYYETTILWINNIARDRQWSWRQTRPPLQNCHLSSKEWLPRKNKELLLSMRSQEAPPSKLLSQLFLKWKAVVANAIQISHLSVNRDCLREKMWPKKVFWLAA